MHEMLGKRVKDVVTGFEGIAICYSEYLTGCNTVGISPGVGQDGKVGDAAWFDETRVEVIDDGVRERFVPKKRRAVETRSGGPQEHPRGIV